MKPPTIGIINYCNFSCKHCLVSKSARPVYMDRHLFSHIIRQVRDLGFRYAGIAGSGELSLHPQLEDIFFCLTENNIDFEILTNGFLFKERIFPLLKDPLIKKRVQRVGFSLDSAKEEVHDSNRQEGSFIRVVEGTALCRLLGIPFYVKTAITNINKKELKEIIFFTSGLGAFSQSFIFPMPTQMMIEQDLIPNPGELYRLFTRLVSWINIFPGLKIEAFNTTNDLFTCNAFYKFGIDEGGNYVLCNNLCNVAGINGDLKGQECLGSLKETGLKDLIIKHINLLPEILQWRFSRKQVIKSTPFSLCTWCFYQFEKLNWLKEYPDSPWTRCLSLTSTD